MVLYILAAGLLFGIGWYLYSSLGQPGIVSSGAAGYSTVATDTGSVVVDSSGNPAPPGNWVGVGNAKDGTTTTRTGTGGTGYSPPPNAARKIAGTTWPADVAPSTGPAFETRSGRGHF